MPKKDDNLLIWIISGAIGVLLLTNGYSIVLKLWGAQTFYSWNLAADFLCRDGVILKAFGDSLSELLPIISSE